MSTKKPTQDKNLLAWLDTAITRREETARAVGYGRIETGEYLWVSKYLILQDGPDGESKVTTEMPAELAEHIALNDPASVLRRCAADRKLLELHAPTTGYNTHGGSYTACSACGTAEEYPVRFPCPTVLAIAEGYGWTEGER